MLSSMGDRGATGGGADATARLLAIGDIHLGRRPAALPQRLLADAGIEPRELGPAAALRRAVEVAVAEPVDAVLLAGDVVESANARFEALAPLEAALDRLATSGIPVIAVAGNHDVEALPRLARLARGFRLLGARGRWESAVVEAGGRPALEVLGWSFPRARAERSPVSALLREPVARTHAGLPRIGLLHADLDASAGPYAPVTRAELEAAGVDAWLLGHIHAPSLLAARSRAPGGLCGYLGSLVGLDPSESGPHGPWLIEVLPDGIRARQLPLAPLRWERANVEVDPDRSAEDVGDLVATELERIGSAVVAAGADAPLALGVRVRLTGRTGRREELRRAARPGGPWEGMARSAGGMLAFLAGPVELDLDLAIDLEELARGKDPAALLARQLLILARDGDARRALLEAAREALRPAARSPQWASLEGGPAAPDPLSEDALVRVLRASATDALDRLLGQQQGGAADAGESG